MLNFRAGRILYFSVFIILARRHRVGFKFESFERGKIRHAIITYSFLITYTDTLKFGKIAHLARKSTKKVHFQGFYTSKTYFPLQK